MATNPSLSALRVPQLRHVLRCIGRTVQGPKADLEQSLIKFAKESRPFPKPPRIVSVDMGIRNLAICVLESPDLAAATTDQSQPTTRLKILDWKKIDVLSQTAPISLESSSKRKVHSARGEPEETPTTQFLPSRLSKTALAIAKDLLHRYDPTHILIERQRFRSGGAAAVQEWTLRVNMLESMIWASLETLRAVHSELSPLAKGEVKGFPDVEGVSPAQVAKFWFSAEGVGKGTVLDSSIFDQNGQNGRAAEPRGKIDKSAKVQLVKSWLSTQGDSSASGIHLELGDNVRHITDAFKSEGQKGRSRRLPTIDAKTHIGKLDDLADSLLQGAAWVRWEENRRRLATLLHRKALN